MDRVAYIRYLGNASVPLQSGSGHLYAAPHGADNLWNILQEQNHHRWVGLSLITVEVQKKRTSRFSNKSRSSNSWIVFVSKLTCASTSAALCPSAEPFYVWEIFIYVPAIRSTPSYSSTTFIVLHQRPNKFLAWFNNFISSKLQDSEQEV